MNWHPHFHGFLAPPRLSVQNNARRWNARRLHAKSVFDRRLRSNSCLRQQLAPRASQRLLNSDCGRHQHIDVTALNFLDTTDIEVYQFGQLFLRHTLFRALTTHVCPDLLELSLSCQIIWHALLGRILKLTRTAQWGVI